MQCKLCGKEFKNYDALRRHSGKIHKIHAKDLYANVYLDGKHPTCKCGCGEITAWNGHGFKDYLRGHISRIHNNWGHNKSAIEHSAETRRERFKSGEIQVWNKGLDISDPRVASQGKSFSENVTNEMRVQRSLQMRQHRLDGIIPTRYGKDSPNWKGGTSSVSMLVYANNRLYKEWKYPILVRDGFKCIECGNDDYLHVHHDEEWLSDIIEKFMTEINCFDDKQRIAEQVVQYHIENGVSGKTLCAKCHEKYHPSLNFGV